MNDTLWRRRLVPRTCFQWLQLRELMPTRFTIYSSLLSLRKNLIDENVDVELYYWFECQCRLKRLGYIITNIPFHLIELIHFQEITREPPERGDDMTFKKHLLNEGLFLTVNESLNWVFRLYAYNISRISTIHSFCLLEIRGLFFNFCVLRTLLSPTILSHVKQVIQTIIRTGFSEKVGCEISVASLLCFADLNESCDDLVSQTALADALRRENMEFPMDRFYNGMVEAVIGENYTLVEFLVNFPDLLMTIVDVATCLTRCLIYSLSLPNNTDSMRLHREISIMRTNVKLACALQPIHFIWNAANEGRFGDETDTILRSLMQGGLSRLLTLFTFQLVRVSPRDISFFRKTIDTFWLIMGPAFNSGITRDEFYSVADLKALLQICRTDVRVENNVKTRAIQRLELAMLDRQRVRPSNPQLIKLAWHASYLPFEETPLPEENTPGALLNLLAFSRTSTADTNGSTIAMFKFFQKIHQHIMQHFPDKPYLELNDGRPYEMQSSVLAESGPHLSACPYFHT